MVQMNFYRSMSLDQSKGFGRSETESLVITDKQTHALALIQEFIKSISENPGKVAYILTYPANRLFIAPCKPLSSFFHYIRMMMEAYDERLHYSPELALFFKLRAVCSWAYEDLLAPKQMCQDGATMAQRFNELIVKIRGGLSSAPYKQEVRDREWNQSRNHQSAQEYVAALFSCYARLLVIRVDLGYPFDTDLHANTHLAVMQQDMERFKRLLGTDPLFDEMVGYLFKLEYGLTKGHHLHCMIFFDGSKVKKDVFIAQKIGEVWKKTTKHRGGFFNCNGKKDSYKYLGIGMINHDDVEKRQNLNLALRYLFKAEQFLSYRYKEKTRVYFRGLMPDYSEIRPGRPRQINQITRQITQGCGAKNV